MPEPTMDLLTADGEALRQWFDVRDSAQRDNRAVFVQMRDAIVAAARAVPVELTEREVAEAWDATMRPFLGPLDGWSAPTQQAVLAFARRLARPSEAALREARREGGFEALSRAAAGMAGAVKVTCISEADRWLRDFRDREYAPPPKPTPSVTLSDGSVVRMMDLGGFIDRLDANGKRMGSIRALHGVEDAVTELLTDKDSRGDEKAVRGLFAALRTPPAPLPREGRLLFECPTCAAPFLHDCPNAALTPAAPTTEGK